MHLKVDTCIQTFERIVTDTTWKYLTPHQAYKWDLDTTHTILPATRILVLLKPSFPSVLVFMRFSENIFGIYNRQLKIRIRFLHKPRSAFDIAYILIMYICTLNGRSSYQFHFRNTPTNNIIKIKSC